MMRSALTWILIVTLQGLGVMTPTLAETNRGGEQEAALEFRRIFAAHGASQYSEDAIRKLIFLPNEKILDRRLTDPSSVEAVLAARRREFRTLLPSQLYKEAALIPHPSPRVGTRQPLTIVIIPGIFGEFIDRVPYEEILRNRRSAFAQEWANLWREGDLTDTVFDLASMRHEQRPLRELVAAGSLDDADGQAETRILLLKAPKGSLESLGTLQESAAIYQRRLDLVFQRLDREGPVYILGYSRGLNVGMELVSSTNPAHHPWMNNVKGLVGLGGVTYGSAVADRALDPERSEGQILNRLERLAAELEVPHEAGQAKGAAALMLRNTKRWAKALAELAAISQSMPAVEGLELEQIRSENLDPGFLVKTFRDLALTSFNLDRPFSDYARNIRRFQLFVREAREGIDSLSSASCMEWIRTHELPETLHYYAITSSMPDPSSRATGIAPLTANTLAFNPQAVDYRALRASYYTYYEESGMALNDSQISLDRSPFWPELHQLANPRQKPFETTLLAVLGTDHWGMAFPVAFETTSARVNPFPRTLLMKTIGDYLGTVRSLP